ncbi:MAG: helicase-associated domain-containing protein [Candidatus Sumerlaeia bacterium]|nr:helicase-associated domain-containing protein [Candidatus Sumerlaeia bacterium]
MKLKTMLRSLPLEHLQTIVDFWNISRPDLDADQPDSERRERLIEHLYPRLQMAQHVLPAFEKLADDEKDLIYFLVIHGGDLPADEVLERVFNGDRARMEAAVKRLSSLAFVAQDVLPDERGETVLIGLPESFMRIIPLPAHWQGYLGYFLEGLPAAHLKQIATEGLRLTVDSTRKDYLIYRIRSELLEPNRLRQHVARLAPAEREMLRNVLERKGVCVYRDLLDTGFQKRYDHSKAEHVNALLSRSGLLFTAAIGDNKYNNLLMVPRDIYHIMEHNYTPDRRSLRELDTISYIGRAQQPTYIFDNSNNLLRDIVIFASYINRNTVRKLSTGGIGKNDLKKILLILSAHKTPKYAAFLALFLITRKFLVPVGNVWRVNQTFLRWLEDSRQCYQDILQFWLETNLWNEEYLEGDTKHTDSPPTGLVNAPELRKLVLDNMASIPISGWIQFEAFAENISPQVEMFIPRREGTGGYDRFNRTNRAILESVVGETLYWMGIVSLGVYDLRDINEIGHQPPILGEGRWRRGPRPPRPYKPFLFQLTPLGRFVLDGPYTEPAKLFQGRDDTMLPLQCEAKHFIVQPNLEIITPPDLDLHTFYRLNEFCDIKAVDVMSTLTIARDSLREGMDKGVRGEDILQFISEHSLQAVPETVRHLIQECSDKHGELDMAPVSGYIRVADRILLEELKSNRRIQPAIKEVVGDHMILLRENVDIRKMARELQRLGFMPRLEAAKSRIADKETSYQFTLSQDELYTLLALLNHCAAVEEEVGVTVTGDKIPALMERLRPEGPGAFNVTQFAESIGKEFTKKFQAALRKKIEDIQSKYKKQVSRLVSTRPSETARGFFQGPNPATERDDMLEMAEFAVRQNLAVEITYERPDREPLIEKVVPKKIVGDRIFAFSEKRRRLGAYQLERIRQLRLLGPGG